VTRRCRFAGDLPDISGFTQVSDAAGRDSGLRLLEIGFDAPTCAAMWQAHKRPPGPAPAHLAWRAQQRDDPCGVVYRLFHLGAEVSESLARHALTDVVNEAAL
jgi:hypothetical protein